jgi:hypothetical protein
VHVCVFVCVRACACVCVCPISYSVPNAGIVFNSHWFPVNGQTVSIHFHYFLNPGQARWAGVGFRNRLLIHCKKNKTKKPPHLHAINDVKWLLFFKGGRKPNKRPFFTFLYFITWNSPKKVNIYILTLKDISISITKCLYIKTLHT